MPTPFPTLRSGSYKYPLVRTKAYKTGVLRFNNGSEQRWRSVGALQPIALEYSNLNGYDLSLIREFFRAAKGAFATDLQITLAGVTYSNLALDQDDFTPTQQGPGRFRLSLKFRQTKG